MTTVVKYQQAVQPTIPNIPVQGSVMFIYDKMLKCGCIGLNCILNSTQFYGGERRWNAVKIYDAKHQTPSMDVLLLILNTIQCNQQINKYGCVPVAFDVHGLTFLGNTENSLHGQFYERFKLHAYIRLKHIRKMVLRCIAAHKNRFTEQKQNKTKKSL